MMTNERAKAIAQVEFKARARSAGGHVDVDLFTRTPPTETWANCGKLCMSPIEFEVFLFDVSAAWEIEDFRGAKDD